MSSSHDISKGDSFFEVQFFKFKFLYIFFVAGVSRSYDQYDQMSLLKEVDSLLKRTTPTCVFYFMINKTHKTQD